MDPTVSRQPHSGDLLRKRRGGIEAAGGLEATVGVASIRAGLKATLPERNDSNLKKNRFFQKLEVASI